MRLEPALEPNTETYRSRIERREDVMRMTNRVYKSVQEHILKRRLKRARKLFDELQEDVENDPIYKRVPGYDRLRHYQPRQSVVKDNQSVIAFNLIAY